MTQLYLQTTSDGWTPVYHDTAHQLKIVRENPRFTSSGTYTLEIIIPLAGSSGICLANRSVFGHLHRADTSRHPQEFPARLYVADRLIIDGRVVVTSVSQDAVRMQLLGGNAETNRQTAMQNKYIDEMPYTEFEHERMQIAGLPANPTLGELMATEVTAPFFRYFPVYDTTNDRHLNYGYELQPVYNAPSSSTVVGYQWREAPISTRAIQPNLLRVLYSVIARFGYRVTRCDLSATPAAHLYIVNPRPDLPGTGVGPATDWPAFIRRALPHWTAAEFIAQVQNLFNAVVVFDDRDHTAAVISATHTGSSAAGSGNQDFTPATPDDFEADVAAPDDDNGGQLFADSNVCYELDETDAPSLDTAYRTVDRKLLDYYEKKTFSTIQLARQFCSQHPAEAQRYVICIGHATYLCDDAAKLWRIDAFGPLTRKKDTESDVTLKCVPAISQRYRRPEDYPVTQIMEVAAENPAPDTDSFDYAESLYQAIVNGVTPPEAANEQKAPHMLLAFTLPRTHNAEIIRYPEWDMDKYPAPYPYHAPFTIGATELPDAAADWTLSLQPQDESFSIGKLHTAGIAVDGKALHRFTIIADDLPDPTRVFNIRGKRYLCQKIEATVSNGDLDRLMTAYLYPVL